MENEVARGCSAVLKSFIFYQVDITELVKPEVVDGGGDSREVVGFEASITESNSSTQPGQDPPV